jgi:hypothetical protein
LRDLRFRLQSRISFSAFAFNVSGYKIKVLKFPPRKFSPFHHVFFKVHWKLYYPYIPMKQDILN